MGENSAIEWTDHTFNPWMGCTKVAAGCANCYAERDMDKHYHKVQWGPHGTRVKTVAANWAKPLKWNREAAEAGVRARVFCASLADVFEDWDREIRDHKGKVVHKCEQCGTLHGGDSISAYGFECGAVAAPFDKNPRRCGGLCRVISMDDLRRDLFALIDATPELDWILLTKRPENIKAMWPRGYGAKIVDPDYQFFRRNVWLLTSIAEQADYDKNRWPLAECRELVPVLGYSAEPLVGPIDLGDDFWESGCCVDWVIVGGESGPDARPMHPDWARSIRDQCLAAGVAFHFKQWGESLPFDQCGAAGIKLPIEDAMNHAMSGAPVRCGKKKAGRLLDGREWNEYPRAAVAPETNLSMDARNPKGD